MKTVQRYDRYQAGQPGDKALTPAQRRRLKQKAGSRKAHAHKPGKRCRRCQSEPQA